MNEANEEHCITIMEMLRRTVPGLGEFVDFPVPQEICEICRDQLKIAYRFQRICLATNEEMKKLWEESQKADGEVKDFINQQQSNENDEGEGEQEIKVDDLDNSKESDPIKLELNSNDCKAVLASQKCEETMRLQDESVKETDFRGPTLKENSLQFFMCTLCLKRCRTNDILRRHMRKCHQESVAKKNHFHEDDEDDNKPLITLKNKKALLNGKCETQKELIIQKDKESHIDDNIVNISITSNHHCPSCNKEFQYAHHLSKHHCKPIIRQQQNCEICCKQFSSLRVLRKHRKNVHAGLQWPKDAQHNVETQISQSRPQVTNKDENMAIILENNIEKEADKTPNEFRETESSISDQGEDGAEVGSDCFEKEKSSIKSRTLSSCKEYSCTECNAIFRFGKQLERHIKKHTDAHRFVCLVCSDRFKYPFMLQKHVEKHHPEESIKPKAVECKKQLMDKSYICNYCPAAYTNVGGLAQHMSKKHPEIVPFNCDKCDKTFVVEEHLKIHTNRHMGIKNFKCDLCDKSFSFKFAMKQHMRVHTGDLNYLCTLCGKKFYRPSNLRQHMQRHGDDKPYTCPHCPKRFKCPSDRYIHLMSHQEGKNHVCPTCGARFSRVDTLHQHQILHTGEKPYKCDQCPMAFPRLMNLNRHLRTHTGEKPYKCKYCDKAYAQSNDLNKHVRTHVGENTYMCTQCPAAFKYQAELRNHEWEHYRKQKEEEEASCTQGGIHANDVEMRDYSTGGKNK